MGHELHLSTKTRTNQYGKKNKIEGPLASPYERKLVLCVSEAKMEQVIQPKDKAQFLSTKEASADPPLFPSSFRCMDQAHTQQRKDQRHMGK